MPFGLYFYFETSCSKSFKIYEIGLIFAENLTFYSMKRISLRYVKKMHTKLALVACYQTYFGKAHMFLSNQVITFFCSSLKSFQVK